jgi:hypothetical protein
MIRFFILIATIIITNLSFAQTIKDDILRIEFIDDNGVETIDLKREYIKGHGRLLVNVKPEYILDENKDQYTPNVVWKIDVQAGTVSVLSNFSQIPGDTGTEFNIDGQTIANYRLYLSSLIKDKHEIRFLYAPLEYSTTLNSQTDIFFRDSIFLAGTDAEAFYKFNSYRLSYIYHFDQVGAVQFRLGFTAKIRDAETSLRQNQVYERYPNIGFVPLIHIGAKIELSKKLTLDAEVEGSWAPQGYAFDNRLSLNYQLTDNLSIGAGAGYLDGGANVPAVNTFAKLFYGYGKITYTFPSKKKKRKKKKKKKY